MPFLALDDLDAAVHFGHFKFNEVLYLSRYVGRSRRYRRFRSYTWQFEPDDDERYGLYETIALAQVKP